MKRLIAASLAVLATLVASTPAGAGAPTFDVAPTLTTAVLTATGPGFGGQKRAMPTALSTSAASDERKAERPANAVTLDPRSLTRARTIKAETTVRYSRTRGPNLAVTEASSTDVIDSFTLFTTPLDEPRPVSAGNGIWYAVCPVRATCPYPGRSARPAAAFLPRRAALELAVRTFFETAADLVVVSLPTRRFVLLVLERDDLMSNVDLPALRDALAEDPAAAPDTTLRRAVDQLSLPHLFVGSALLPISDTRTTLVASRLFPGPALFK